MRTIEKTRRARVPMASAFVLCCASAMAWAQPPDITLAAQTVLTFVNRLYVNPPAQAVVAGYFVNIADLPDPLFATALGENTAYFTWYLNASGAMILSNGDPGAGGASVAVLPAGASFNIYYNPAPQPDVEQSREFRRGTTGGHAHIHNGNSDRFRTGGARHPDISAGVKPRFRFQGQDLQFR